MADCDRSARLFQVRDGFAQQLFVAQAGDESGLLLERALGRDGFEDGVAQLGDAFAGERRDGQRWRDAGPPRAQIALVADHQCAALPARCDQLSIFGSERLRKIDHHQRQVGIGHRLIAALDAQRFHQLRGLRECRRCRTTSPGMPPMAAVSDTRSRVVPGMSVTMARSCSSRRLNRLLLPTLGRPTMASVRPCVHQAAVLEARGELPRAARGSARGGAEFRRPGPR